MERSKRIKAITVGIKKHTRGTPWFLFRRQVIVKFFGSLRAYANAAEVFISDFYRLNHKFQANVI